MSNYLVCYDIADPRRLRAVFRLIKGRGVHLQYSVFFCTFSPPQLKEIRERLEGIIDTRHDDIRIFTLPDNVKIIPMGKVCSIPDGVEVYIKGEAPWEYNRC